jgi:hypothetical protein
MTGVVELQLRGVAHTPEQQEVSPLEVALPDPDDVSQVVDVEGCRQLPAGARGQERVEVGPLAVLPEQGGPAVPADVLAQLVDPGRGTTALQELELPLGG